MLHLERIFNFKSALSQTAVDLSIMKIYLLTKYYATVIGLLVIFKEETVFLELKGFKLSTFSLFFSALSFSLRNLQFILEIFYV